MTNPTLSCVSTCFGESIDHIQASVQSLLTQSKRAEQLVIILDNPKYDEAHAYFSELSNTHANVVYIRNRENIGLTKSLNIGLERCTSTYIARLDMGDICHVDRFSKQLQYLEANTDVFLLGTGVAFIDDADSMLGSPKYVSGKEKVGRLLARKNVLVHSSIAFRNDGQRYREKFVLAQDYDFYLQALLKGKVVDSIPETLLYFRLSESSLSFQQKYKQWLFADVARRLYLQLPSESGERLSYELFSPDELLRKSDEHIPMVVLKKQVAHLIDMKQHQRARKLLLGWPKSSVSLHDKFKWSLLYVLTLFPQLLGRVR